MFREWRKIFWQPPRAHGDVIEDRTVSFLELFYDLVYVVVIARAAHHLAEHVGWRGAAEFAVVFGLIWIGWLNGTLYYDLHGREDGRTRTLVFAQMLLLALLAVYTADATGETGEEFAIVYAAFLGLLTVAWYSVRRQDSEEYAPITARYLTAMVVSTIVMVVSIFLEPEARLWLWGVFVIIYMVVSVLTARVSESRFSLGIAATDSMVERFGLFVIIVLGEVVVGVVDGISSSDLTPVVVATGMLGLTIGFAFWWSYFDFVGRRLPAESAVSLTRWMLGHLPLTLSIAAAGAAMVSLVEHASDASTPTATAWLLTGSVAFGLVSLMAVMTTLSDYTRFPELYIPVIRSIPAAIAAVVAIGWLKPRPWVIALAIFVVLAAVWANAVRHWMRMDDPASALPD